MGMEMGGQGRAERGEERPRGTLDTPERFAMPLSCVFVAESLLREAAISFSFLATAAADDISLCCAALRALEPHLLIVLLGTLLPLNPLWSQDAPPRDHLSLAAFANADLLFGGGPALRSSVCSRMRACIASIIASVSPSAGFE